MTRDEKARHENSWAWQDHHVGYPAAQAGAKMLNINPQWVTPAIGWEYCAYAPEIREALRELALIAAVAAKDERDR